MSSIIQVEKTNRLTIAITQRKLYDLEAIRQVLENYLVTTSDTS